jgi:putative redox protein
MKSGVTWRTKFTFDGKSRQHAFVLDTSTALGGQDLGATPKELVLAAVCGCTGMDVVGLLRKKKIELRTLAIAAEAESVATHPKVFGGIRLTVEATGDEAWKADVVEAVRLSQTQFCSISAMLSRACPIEFQVTYNGERSYEGRSTFS